MKEEFLLTEKYRPQTINECILPARIKKSFEEFVDAGNIPTLLLYGSAGTGKTTIAKALCNEVGNDVMVINASKERGIDTLRTKITGFASTVSLSDNNARKIIIMDEADSMTPDLQSGMRAAIEEFSSTCGFIFTANFPSKIIDPIHSRCISIDFKVKENEQAQMMGQFMKRVQHILNEENVEYENAVLAQLIKTYFPDFRRTLNELQRYAVGGKIDSGILANISEVKIDDVIKFLREKDFKSMREWAGVNSDTIQSSELFSKLYKQSEKYLEPSSIPQAIILLGEYQYKDALVADKEINIVACLTEIMAGCQFK